MLASLIRDAVARRCDVLLEVHDTKDFATAAEAMESLGDGAERRHIVLGINNRNLDSQTIDLGQTQRLAPLVARRLGRDFPLVAESGIDSPDACRRLAPWVDGFLVGTSLLRSPDPAGFLHSLISSCDRS